VNAIVTPLPEPVAPEPVPEVTVAPSRVHLVRASVAVAIIGALATAALVTWSNVGQTTAQSTTADSLTAQLAWMFDAALTYPAEDRNGQSSMPPFMNISIDSVIVVEQASGPILAVGRATLPDGTVADVTYRVEVVRSGDAWTVRAERLGTTDADAAIRPAGS